MWVSKINYLGGLGGQAEDDGWASWANLIDSILTIAYSILPFIFLSSLVPSFHTSRFFRLLSSSYFFLHSSLSLPLTFSLSHLSFTFLISSLITSLINIIDAIKTVFSISIWNLSGIWGVPEPFPKIIYSRMGGESIDEQIRFQNYKKNLNPGG